MNSYLNRFTQDPNNMRLFQEEGLIVAVTELICEAMNEDGVRRKDLADKLKMNKSRISQLLDGERNLTLRTVARILWALDRKLEVRTSAICNGDAQTPFSKAWQVSFGRLGSQYRQSPTESWTAPPENASPAWMAG